MTVRTVAVAARLRFSQIKNKHNRTADIDSRKKKERSRSEAKAKAKVALHFKQPHRLSKRAREQEIEKSQATNRKLRLQEY